MVYTSIRCSRHARGLASLMALAGIYALAAPQQAAAQTRRTFTPQPIFRSGNNNGQGNNSNYRPQPIFRNNNNNGQGGAVNSGPNKTIQNTGRNVNPTTTANGFGGTGSGTTNGLGGSGGNTGVGKGF